MAVFPPDAANYTDPALDAFVNFGCGALLVPIGVLSLILNGAVIYVNCKNTHKGVSTLLLLTLAASDFLYTAVRVPYVTYNLLNPAVEARVRNHAPTVLQSAVSGVSWICSYSSISAIFGVAIMRFLKLGFPMWTITHKRLTHAISVIPMLVTLLYSLGLQVAVSCDVFIKTWSNTVQQVLLAAPMLVRLATVLAPAGLSLILALATIAMMSRNTTTEVNRYSMTTITLLSVGNMSWILQWIVTAGLGKDYFYNETHGSVKITALVMFVSYVMLPCLTALYNPLVLCVRCARIRRVFVAGFRRCRRPRGNGNIQDSQAARLIE